ncbi:MAG: hypothetical protein ACK53Y_20085, partial [bacterium]
MRIKAYYAHWRQTAATWMKFVDLTDQWVYISTENGISRSPQIQGLQTKIGTRPWCDWNVLT